MLRVLGPLPHRVPAVVRKAWLARLGTTPAPVLGPPSSPTLPAYPASGRPAKPISGLLGPLAPAFGTLLLLSHPLGPDDQVKIQPRSGFGSGPSLNTCQNYPVLYLPMRLGLGFLVAFTPDGVPTPRRPLLPLGRRGLESRLSLTLLRRVIA